MSMEVLKFHNRFLNRSADGAGKDRCGRPVVSGARSEPMSLFEDMAMTQTAKERDFDLDYLLHPAGAFRTPMEVVNDPDMTVQEKRAILASWASDACAVEASPELREPAPAKVVRFDDIMDALKRLDGEAANSPNYGKFINRAQRWKDLYRSDRRGRQLFGRGASC